MKTLVNKTNPHLRITAPEVETMYDKSRCVKYYYVKDLRLGLLEENWTLVEEEPVKEKEEICSKCVYHKKDDGYCYNPNGGMKRRINENGVYECTAFWEREQEEPKRKQSPALKKIVDNLTEEKLAKTRAEMKLEDAAEPVDLEKEIKKHTDLFQADIEYPLRLTAIKFYELGKKGGKI